MTTDVNRLLDTDDLLTGDMKTATEVEMRSTPPAIDALDLPDTDQTAIGAIPEIATEDDPEITSAGDMMTTNIAEIDLPDD